MSIFLIGLFCSIVLVVVVLLLVVVVVVVVVVVFRCVNFTLT